jgi:hypothetical protein
MFRFKDWLSGTKKRKKRRKESKGKLLTVGPSAKVSLLVDGIQHKDSMENA